MEKHLLCKTDNMGSISGNHVEKGEGSRLHKLNSDLHMQALPMLYIAGFLR